MPNLRSQAVRSYAVAVVAIVAAFLLRLTFLSTLGDRAPYFFFLLAVLAAAWYGGLKPGLLATVLGGLLGTAFFIPPWNWFEQPVGAFITSLYLIIGATASGFFGAL